MAEDVGYVEVVNWERFQHYHKGRKPPWIKLYNSLLDGDYDFEQLSDTSKLHLILIWLLASRLDNKIPADEAWLKRKLMVGGPVRLKPLLDAGFLRHASDVLDSCEQRARPEVDTDTETEKTIARSDSSESSSHPVPDELRDLELYAADPKLCRAWPPFLTAAQQAYPGVDILAEVRAAHAWEVANPKRRKKQRTRFLHSWLSRAQDRAPGGQDGNGFSI